MTRQHVRHGRALSRVEVQARRNVLAPPPRRDLPDADRVPAEAGPKPRPPVPAMEAADA